MKFNEQAKKSSCIKSIRVMDGFFGDNHAAKQAISLAFKVVSIGGIPSPLGFDMIDNYTWDNENDHVLHLKTSEKSLPISKRTVVRIAFEKGHKFSDDQIAIGMHAIAHNPMQSQSPKQAKTLI